MRVESRAPLCLLLLAGTTALGCRSARAGDPEPAGTGASARDASKPAETARAVRSGASAAPPGSSVSARPSGPSASVQAPASSASGSAPGASANAPAAASGSCPVEMTRVGKTCVDRWEAVLVVESTGGAHPYNQRPEQGVRYVARSASGVSPQAYINRIEAAAACEAAGKRLCTLGEWYRACRGQKGETWPYGWSEKRGACNVLKPHLLGKLFGNDPRRWDYMKHFNAPELNRTPGWLSKTGEHAECTNAAGTFDMVGNVHEWVSDVVDRTLEQKLPLRDDIRRKLDVNTGHGIFMGGFYSTGDEHGKGCGFVTIGHEPKYHDYSTGFRCCK